MAGVTGFCVVSAAVTQRTGSSAGHRKLHEAVTRHNAALFNLHRLSLHTPLLSHTRARASQYAKRAAHITPDCTHNTQTRRVSQSATDTPVRLWRVQPAACGSRRHASSRSARRPLLRLRVTAAAVRAPPVSLQASCAYTLVFFWMAEMSAQCVGHLARFFMMRSADWMPASQCVWSPRSPYTLVPALRLRVDTLAIWPEMKARNATRLGLMLSAWRTQAQGGARSAVVPQPGSRRGRGAGWKR